MSLPTLLIRHVMTIQVSVQLSVPVVYGSLVKTPLRVGE